MFCSFLFLWFGVQTAASFLTTYGSKLDVIGVQGGTDISPHLFQSMHSVFGSDLAFQMDINKSGFQRQPTKDFRAALTLSSNCTWLLITENAWQRKYYGYLMLNRACRRSATKCCPGLLKCSLQSYEKCLVVLVTQCLWFVRLLLMHDIESNPGPAFKKGDLVFACTPNDPDLPAWPARITDFDDTSTEFKYEIQFYKTHSTIKCALSHLHKFSKQDRQFRLINNKDFDAAMKEATENPNCIQIKDGIELRRTHSAQPEQSSKQPATAMSAEQFDSIMEAIASMKTHVNESIAKLKSELLPKVDDIKITCQQQFLSVEAKLANMQTSVFKANQANSSDRNSHRALPVSCDSESNKNCDNDVNLVPEQSNDKRDKANNQSCNELPQEDWSKWSLLTIGSSNLRKLYPHFNSFALKNRFTRWIGGGHIFNMTGAAIQLLKSTSKDRTKALLTVHVGINDVIDYDFEVIKRNYAKMFKSVKMFAASVNKEVKFVVCSIPPRFEVLHNQKQRRELFDKINAVNKYLAILCSKNDSVFLDMVQLQKGAIGPDGVHYTPEGTQRVANAIMNHWSYFLVHGRFIPPTP
jgi:hypothetical protein